MKGFELVLRGADAAMVERYEGMIEYSRKSCWNNGKRTVTHYFDGYTAVAKVTINKAGGFNVWTRA